MQIEKIKWKISPIAFSCFRCRKQEATHKATLNLEHGGNLTVCLCDDCSKFPETELYAHFMEKGGKNQWDKN